MTFRLKTENEDHVLNDRLLSAACPPQLGESLYVTSEFGRHLLIVRGVHHDIVKIHLDPGWVSYGKASYIVVVVQQYSKAWDAGQIEGRKEAEAVMASERPPVNEW